MGNYSRLLGEQNEAAVRAVNQRYMDEGLGYFWQVGTRAVHRGGKWQPLKSPPDFMGVVDGRHFDFDAKVTTQPRYSHPKNKMHQCNHLYEISRAGGVGFLLVTQYLEDAIRAYVMPPQPHWADTEKGWSIKLEPSKYCHPVPVRYFANAPAPDYLETALALVVG